MVLCFAKVSEEEIKATFFYPSDLVNTKTTIPPPPGLERSDGYTGFVRVMENLESHGI